MLYYSKNSKNTTTEMSFATTTKPQHRPKNATAEKGVNVPLTAHA